MVLGCLGVLDRQAPEAKALMRRGACLSWVLGRHDAGLSDLGAALKTGAPGAARSAYIALVGDMVKPGFLHHDRFQRRDDDQEQRQRDLSVRAHLKALRQLCVLVDLDAQLVARHQTVVGARVSGEEARDVTAR